MFTKNNQDQAKQIKQIGKEIGFDLIHITSAEPSSHYQHYNDWIQKNYHGEMGYLKDHAEKKADPKFLFPEVKSIICCGLSYKTSTRQPMKAKSGHGLISNYAWGDDYHIVIKKMLKHFLKRIQESFPGSEGRYYVDTGPLLERSFAQRSGMGWVGKNTCLINQEYGSYLFLAEILLNIDLEPERAETDHCGSCTKCLDACPTQAFTQAYEMDATKCISYLTIEKRGELTASQKTMIGDHLFGCDICQQVCPWNDKAITPHHAPFQPRSGLVEPSLTAMADLTEESFKTLFRKSPVKRTKYEGFKRNVDAVGRSLSSPA